MDTRSEPDISADIARKVKEIVIEALHLTMPPAEMDETRRLDTLGLDSLNIVDILLGLEREFDIAFDEDDIDFSMLDSVGSLAEFVRRARAEQGRA